MKTSFKVHAGLALTLSVTALSASALVLLPGQPLLDNTALFAGIGFALLFLLFLATIVRGIALDFGGGGSLSSPWLQWLALRCLPRTVQAVLVCVFAAGGRAGGHLQASDAAHGRYYAVDTADPHRRHVEVTKSEYHDVNKHDQRFMFAITGRRAARRRRGHPHHRRTTPHVRPPRPHAHPGRGGVRQQPILRLRPGAQRSTPRILPTSSPLRPPAVALAVPAVVHRRGKHVRLGGDAPVQVLSLRA